MCRDSFRLHLPFAARGRATLLGLGLFSSECKAWGKKKNGRKDDGG